MHTQHQNGPPYVPKLNDIVRVGIPELSPNDIYSVVCFVRGSVKQGKILVCCSQGGAFAASNIQLIWKRGTNAWEAWFVGKKYRHARVQKAR